MPNKTAIITGASRGIGARIAKKLAQEGYDIAIVDIGDAALSEGVIKECKSCGVEAKSYYCSVSDFEATKELVKNINEDFGSIDVLVNNAGITRDGLILTMSEENFDRVIETNLKGTFNMIRNCAGFFIRKRSGAIVNISSVSGMMGNAGQSNYSASKAGVIGLTKSVAKELSKRGIRCNAVAPGFIDTDMTRTLSVDAEEITKQIPLGRYGTPDDVAEAVVFLVKADYITGEVLRVDGGIGM